MDLVPHLETFVAVAEQGSFTRAAESLGIPQPLLSRRIRNLERVWGEALFDRGARQVTPTRFAALMLPQADAVLQRVRHLDSALAAARSQVEHVVGLPPDCAPVAVARVIRAAVDAGLAVTVSELAAEERAAAHASGALAIAALRVSADEAPLRARLGLARAGHPAAAVHLDTLRRRRGARTRAPELRVLMLDEDAAGAAGERLRRALARAGVPGSAVREAPSAAAAAAEVLAERAVLLCGRGQARRLGLGWSPLADRSLDRGYEIAVQPSLLAHRDGVDAIVGRVRTALGAHPGAEEPGAGDALPAGAGASVEHLRLAASGR